MASISEWTFLGQVSVSFGKRRLMLSSGYPDGANKCFQCFTIISLEENMGATGSLFMWKCFNNAVATNSALVAWKIRTDPVCLRCGKAEESITHLLFRCEPAIKVWTLSPFRLRPEELQECRHMTDWWECLQERIAQNHLPSSSMGLGRVPLLLVYLAC